MNLANPSADLNLLFGILAVQMDFITRDQLMSAMSAWVLDKSKPLGSILIEQKALGLERHMLLQALVKEHLKQHQNDPQQSLAAVSSVGSVKRELEQIADSDVQASIVHVSRSSPLAEGHDPYATTAAEASKATGDGVRFRILRPHAKGGLGEVFVAHDEELHREVALKEIQSRHADNPENRARFVLEAEITGALEHPGIVPVYGLGTYADGRPFYAMRFIRGDSLQDAIEHFHKDEVLAAHPGKRVLALRKLLGRFIDVCHAMQYAHDRGVLHRDLKPGNIMLGKYGETLVVDWGLAKAVGKSDDVQAKVTDETILDPASIGSSAETVAGSAIGTPAFMSPEQAAGRIDQLGPASDVYSLGATLYTLLTGKLSIEDRDLGTVLKRVQQGDFPKPRQVQPLVQPALEAICLKAMALKPADRYASPHDLYSDIEHWLADEPVKAWPEPMWGRVRRWMRHHKPLVTGIAGALLVGLSALTIGFIWYENHQVETARQKAIADADSARKQGIAEEQIRQALDRASMTRDDLHKTLKQPGGVQELLNRPERWEFQIKSARADLQRAKDHAAETSDPQWADRLKTLDEQFTRDQADFKFALRLEKIRIDRADSVEGKFDIGRTLEEYSSVFAEAGLEPAPGRQKEVALLIQQSAIKDQLLAALDDWAYCEPGAKSAELTARLLEVARLADPHPWRNKVRDPDLWKNEQAMVKLAQEAQADKVLLAGLSPQMLVLVSILLRPGETQEKWLRSAQALHPADFWINFRLGFSLKEKNAQEAAGFFRVGLAIRPNNAAVYSNLGGALRNPKDSSAAIDACEKALAIDPKLASAWYNLGTALVQSQKDYPAAIDAYQKALANGTRNAAHAWYGLGFALQHQKDLPAAISAYKKAIDLDPGYAEAHCNLGHALRDQEQLSAALRALQEGHRLGSLRKDWRYPSAEWVMTCQNLLADQLAKADQSSYSKTEHKGQLSAKAGEQSRPIKMIAGKSYLIDMKSPQFDTLLRLLNDQGKVVAENNDISPTNKNSRIVFVAHADGTYRIIATSFEKRGVGAYTLTIREFTAKKN